VLRETFGQGSGSVEPGRIHDRWFGRKRATTPGSALMPVARLGDLHMYYEINGAGPRLLFASGTGGDLRVRPNVFDGPLAKRFEVLAYDQRGLGQTTKPPGRYRMQDYADDAARLLDHLGWGPVPVIGSAHTRSTIPRSTACTASGIRRHPPRHGLACCQPGALGGAARRGTRRCPRPTRSRSGARRACGRARATTRGAGCTS
jgi:hypothetical protein